MYHSQGRYDMKKDFKYDTRQAWRYRKQRDRVCSMKQNVICDMRWTCVCPCDMRQTTPSPYDERHNMTETQDTNQDTQQNMRQDTQQDTKLDTQQNTKLDTQQDTKLDTQQDTKQDKRQHTSYHTEPIRYNVSNRQFAAAIPCCTAAAVLMEEDGTSAIGIRKDGINANDTGKDEVNAARVLCALCMKNNVATQCPRCQHLFCDFCWLIHRNGKCKGYTETYQDKTEVEKAVTPAPIEQTPPETYFDKEIRKHHPEYLLQILAEDGTSKVNAAIGLCAKCNRNIKTRRCPRCQLIFCKPCLNNHHNEICKGTGISLETCQDKTIRVGEAVTLAPIGQTPPVSHCAEEIKNYLPEGCLQFLVENNTSEDDTSTYDTSEDDTSTYDTSEDDTSTYDTSKDDTSENEANVAKSLCSACGGKTPPMRQCRDCLLFFCKNCYLVHYDSDHKLF